MTQRKRPLSPAQRQARRRAEAVESGHCGRCGHGKPKKGKRTCEACLAEISALVALRRATLTPPMERHAVRLTIAMADHDDTFRDVLIRRLSRKVVRSAWPARRDAALEAFPGMPKGVQRAIRRWARRSPAGGTLSVDAPLYTQQLVAGVEAYMRWAAIAELTKRESGMR